MNIKNHRSKVEAIRSIAKIEDMLIEVGATNISKQFIDKVCTGITFKIYDSHLLTTQAFHLRSREEECFSMLWKKSKRPRINTKANLLQQANRTAWKILYDRTEIKCSLMLLGKAKE